MEALLRFFGDRKASIDPEAVQKLLPDFQEFRTNHPGHRFYRQALPG